MSQKDISSITKSNSNFAPAFIDHLVLPEKFLKDIVQ